jgi:hypothetical protein
MQETFIETQTVGLKPELDITKTPEYEIAKRNISTVSSPDIMQIIDEYSAMIEQNSQQFQGSSSKLLYHSLSYFGFSKYATALQQRKISASMASMNVKIENLEKLVKVKKGARDKTFQARIKTTALLDDARFVSESNASQYEYLQRKKEELVSQYRTVTDTVDTGIETPTLTQSEIESQLHEIDMQLEGVNREGVDALNIYKQNSLERQLLNQEYQKLQNEITVLSGLKAITQHNFKVYKTIQLKMRDPSTKQNELELVKGMYTINEQLGTFVNNLKQGFGNMDVYASLEQNLPPQVQVEKEKSSSAFETIPSWIHEVKEISNRQKQATLKQ